MHNSQSKMKMKNIKIMMLTAVLTLMWGCSSDDDGNENNGNNSTSVSSPKPTWAINWSSDITPPDWQDPDVTKYECSMDMLITLSKDITPYSTDGDLMALFMNGECRGVGYRNVMSDGSVAFLLHVKGSSEEAEKLLELRFYCDSLHYLSIKKQAYPFTPNNLMDETYQAVLDLGYGSTKYPYFTEMTVEMPELLPFTKRDDDMLAVFVGDECRGVGMHDSDIFPGWRVVVYSYQPHETAYIRYYSAEKGCIYTIQNTFTLSNLIQQETIAF